MARSLIGGMVARGYQAHAIRVAEPVTALREAMQRDFGIQAFEHAQDAIQDASQWLLAVKPQVMRAVCHSLAPLAQARKPLVLSIAAGITAPQLEGWLGGALSVVRAMPNTPALLGVGITGLFANATTSVTQRDAAATLLQAVGPTVWMDDECQMDAVTAVSGSGPAYVFLLAEAMQAAGIEQGLSADAARVLVQQTLLGAATMLTRLPEPADVLRARVTSPGGTTQAAIDTLEAGGFRELIGHAIAAAARRGHELSLAND